MTSDSDICSYCRNEPVDLDDPRHRLCHECLTEHSMTWAKLDRQYLSN
jgi:hypothetical protein